MTEVAPAGTIIIGVRDSERTKNTNKDFKIYSPKKATFSQCGFILSTKQPSYRAEAARITYPNFATTKKEEKNMKGNNTGDTDFNKLFLVMGSFLGLIKLHLR